MWTAPIPQLQHPAWIESLLTSATDTLLVEGVPSDEGLEFLGDAILSFVLSERLHNMFPNKPAGDLAAFKSGLMATPQVAKFYRELQLPQRNLSEEHEDQKLRAKAFKKLLGKITVLE